MNDGLCEMTKVHHPDCECAICKSGQDERCAGSAVGTYERTARVCAECALAMLLEDFAVTYDPGKEPTCLPSVNS
jgi:hypothetical protein